MNGAAGGTGIPLADPKATRHPGCAQPLVTVTRMAAHPNSVNRRLHSRVPLAFWILYLREIFRASELKSVRSSDGKR